MTHIVQDLLTLSRFDSGRSELDLTVFPFGEVLRDSYRAVLLEAQRHGHVLGLTGAEDLPEIRADRERVLQVIMNILSNAIKYADDGIGIPEQDRARIFERFYRVDKARSRASGGTGLGLSIALEIVARHEGTLTLVDRPGPGTTVRMELKIGGPEA